VKIANEIVITEHSYVQSLRTMERIYIAPLLMCAQDTNKKFKLEVELDHVNRIFSNIQMIATLNENFLNALYQVLLFSIYVFFIIIFFFKY